LLGIKDPRPQNPQGSDFFEIAPRPPRMSPGSILQAVLPEIFEEYGVGLKRSTLLL